MVNLYDFDGTIYDGDSTVDFYLFCLKKKFRIILVLPLFFIFALLYFLKLVNKTKMKEKFFGFLLYFSDIDDLVLEFWNLNNKKIKKFYLEKDHKNDIIISASPYFLLKSICDRLKVKKLIASPVNKVTGIYEGNNCDGVEKVKRLNSECGCVCVNDVYSDSYNDIPIWKLGKRAYLVRRNKIMLLDKNKFKKK